MWCHITHQHVCCIAQQSNDAVNAPHTMYAVGSVTVNFKEMGQEAAAAVGIPLQYAGGGHLSRQLSAVVLCDAYVA